MWSALGMVCSIILVGTWVSFMLLSTPLKGQHVCSRSFGGVQRSPGKTGSHFNPKSPLFNPSERNQVLTSTACYAAMAALLVGK